MWGMPELHRFWEEEQEINIPFCHCGSLVGLHFGANHLPPYLYCRGSGSVNCQYFMTGHQCPDLRVFFASVHVNLFNIYGAYINCVPRLRQAQVVDDLDTPIIRTLLVHFLAAARSRLR